MGGYLVCFGSVVPGLFTYLFLYVSKIPLRCTLSAPLFLAFLLKSRSFVQNSQQKIFYFGHSAVYLIVDLLYNVLNATFRNQKMQTR